jgi:cyclophilin family peptidyl-prolyl cis-trans isomerase
MKKLLLSLLAVGLAGAARADDIALVSLRIAKEKKPREFAIEFYPDDAPRTVENFKKLAKKGFYKGTTVHRAFARTLVQMGDPLSRKKDRSTVGTGGPGYTLPPEIRRKHVKGAVAAARLPDKINPSRVSNGSQFYVCLQPMPNLDGQYTVFGRLIWGAETLDLISTKSVDSNDNPIERIEIRSVKIMPREKLPAAPPAEQPAAGGAKPAKKPWWKIFG